LFTKVLLNLFEFSNQSLQYVQNLLKNGNCCGAAEILLNIEKSGGNLKFLKRGGNCRGYFLAERGGFSSVFEKFGIFLGVGRKWWSL
jgi:hypothetical protein